MTAADIWLFFVLPFVIMFVAMLAQIAIRSKSYAGEIPWDDTQREAYIAAVIGAFITVIVTVIIGGPEMFVLFWRPLITTVIMLPLSFAAALFVFGVWRAARK